jgi:hypothetical protein
MMNTVKSHLATEGQTVDIEAFVALLRDELGMDVTADDIGRTLDELPDWDSAHLLWLLTALERGTGAPLSLPDLISAGSLGEIHALTVSR